MTSQPFAAQVLSRVSKCPISLTPLTAAVRTLNVPNVSSSSRPGGPCVSCGRISSPPASPVAFSEQIRSVFHSVPGVFYPGYCLRSSDVLGVALPPRLDFSIVDTFAYLRMPSEYSSSSHKLGFFFTKNKQTKKCPTSGERLNRWYTKIDFAVDDGKKRLNPSREKK